MPEWDPKGQENAHRSRGLRQLHSGAMLPDSHSNGDATAPFPQNNLLPCALEGSLLVLNLSSLQFDFPFSDKSHELAG